MTRSRPRTAPRARRGSQWSLVALVWALVFALLAAACSSSDTGSDNAPDTAGELASSASESAVAATESVPESTETSLSAGGVEPIRVGVLLDETNMMLSIDRQPGIAFAAAIDRINAAGGILGRPVELLQANTTSRLSTVDAESAAMIEAGVSLIVITCELDFARPAVERAQAAGVLVISPCAPEPAWGEGEVGDLALTMVPTPEQLGASMADHVRSLGHDEVAVLIDRTAPEATAECRGFLRRWSTLGGTTTIEADLNLATADSIAADTDLLEGLDTQAIVLCAFWRLGEPILEGIRANGFTQPIIAGPALDSGQWIPDDVDGGLGDFTMLTLASTWGDDPSPAVIDAFADFLAADGVPPTSGRFVLGSDLAELYRLAVTEAGSTDAEAVADTIRGYSGVDVGSGPISFDGASAPSGRALRAMRNDGGSLVFEGLVAG